MTAIRLFEPTYHTIKERLITGFWRPGIRLVTAKLAKELEVSMSPVRDSLCYLAGQNIVDFQPSAGFFVPTIDEARFSDMVSAHQLLLHFAAMGKVDRPFEPEIGDDPLRRTTALFEHIASWSGNPVIVQSVNNLGDRLHAFRRIDPEIFPKWLEEIEALEHAVMQRASGGTLREKLSRYHRARTRNARRFVRLYGDSFAL